MLEQIAGDGVILAVLGFLVRETWRLRKNTSDNAHSIELLRKEIENGNRGNTPSTD